MEMYQSKKEDLFNKSVRNKYDVYNSLFLNLPYTRESNIGALIPLLFQHSKKGLDSGLNPKTILDNFFREYAEIESEEDKIDFMFSVIQYVERQVVLFDSVEDAAFSELKDLEDDVLIKDFYQFIEGKQGFNSISEKLSSFSARIVFTAHPTQFYTPAILDIITRLRSLIESNDIDEIDKSLQQLGLTSLMNQEKPTPLDEAKNIIYYLRHIYYQAVGELYSYIKGEIRRGEFDNPDIIKLGFWPGGDRDGNPYVTADVTMAVADELRISLIKCYYDDIKELQSKLTFRGIDTILENLRKKLYNCMFKPDDFLAYEEIIEPLNDIKDLLTDNYHGLYLKNLTNVIDKVRIFKTHFASLDIRQDHSIHKNTVEAILLKEGLISKNLDEIDRNELISILISRDIKVDVNDFNDDLIKDTINNISQLSFIQEKNGEEGCNRYIISNSEDIFSVLFVYALLRWIGPYSKNAPFDIIPLFETLIGMNASESVMNELFAIPEYMAHLKYRRNKQTMMLGFSDGTKDGGYMKANWSIFKTKENLSAVCEKNGIKAIFFDGRGGPPSRGGGKTHRFYSAQSNSIANHEIQLTIQGQTITSKYGSKEQFIHNCEQLLTAGLSRNIFGKQNDISDEKRKLIEDLANISLEKYQSLKNHVLFIPYLEQKSPLKYYSQANIASRPGKRGTKLKLELKDLRAISFVGAWSQLKQNIPGYFGIGTALKALEEKGKLADLKKTFNETPLFKALILTSMMSLSKSNFRLTEYLKEDKEFGEFWTILKEEYELSKEMILKISSYSELLEEEPISIESIKFREKIVLPLLVIQQYALQKLGNDCKFKSQYEKIIIRSLYGNINASRNSV